MVLVSLWPWLPHLRTAPLTARLQEVSIQRMDLSQRGCQQWQHTLQFGVRAANGCLEVCIRT